MSRFFREMRQLEGKENIVILCKAKATIEGEENVVFLCKAKTTRRQREYCDSL